MEREDIKMEEIEKLLIPIKNELDKITDKKVKAYAMVFVLTMLGYKMINALYQKEEK